MSKEKEDKKESIICVAYMRQVHCGKVKLIYIIYYVASYATSDVEFILLLCKFESPFTTGIKH